MEVESKKLYDFLTGIQLKKYYVDITENLGVTRIDHFEHVRDDDLLSINLTMPEIRRLTENVKKMKRRSIFSKLRKSFRLSGSSSSQSFASSPVQDDVKNGLKCLIDEKELLFGDILGSGAFGYVQKAEWNNSSSKKLTSVAVKCLQQSGCEEYQTQLLEEANAMSVLSHPSLIRLYGVVLTSPVMLVTELAPLDSLSKRLKLEPDKFLISNLCSFVIQIAAGMKYLEEHRVVHRDLAARNILLMSYEKVKIGDFGLARPLQGDQDYYIMESNSLVPYAWCAPECLNFRKFSHASDVWAFGVTVMELFSYGIEPWSGLNGTQILERIDEPLSERPECPLHCPKSMYSIILDHCWNHSPEERAPFSMLEKCLLNVLPHQVRALNDFLKCGESDILSFSKGDFVTVFDTDDEAFYKGQNRSTLEVGTIPVEYVNLARGTISDASEEIASVVHGKRPNSVIDEFRSSRLNSPYLFVESGCDCGSSTGVSVKSCAQHDRLSLNRTSFSSVCSSPDVRSRSSFCEECLSQMSYDSGCYCRCSIYSSSSSKRSSGASIQSVHVKSVSKPIGIPGGKNSMKNHRNNNQDLYEVFPYDSRSLTSTTSRTSANEVIPTENLYDNIDKLSINDKSPSNTSQSIESRQSLPDIVNPTKPTKILHRRKSLPRLRNKRAMSFENKLYKSQSIVGLEARQNSKQSKSNKASSYENTEIQTDSRYETIPSPKVKSKSVSDIGSSEPYQSHGRSKTMQSKTSEVVQIALYDVLPSPKLKTPDPIEEQSLYEDIMNVVSERKRFSLQEPPQDYSNSPQDYSNSPQDYSNSDLCSSLKHENELAHNPSAPPRLKRKQKKTTDEDYQAKIKQCVILQSTL